MDSTSALELPDIPESLLVVGGGYIGLEMGTVYAALGTRVSVVELTDGLLPGADRDLVRPLHKKLAGDFAEIMLSTKVVSMADKGQAIEVTFEPAAGGDRKVQQYSRVLVSVGRRPNSDGIGLENTKVKIDRQGFVQIDPQRRTAEPRIWAIGDVAGQPMLRAQGGPRRPLDRRGHPGARRRLRAAGDSRRRLHRSGNRLGRPDRDRGQGSGPHGGSRPYSPGRPAAGHKQSAAPKG